MPYRARVVALYLPQFHPIPENDRWWGPGFTEWTNVAGARPLFPGHRQPNLPGSLGFYDLRLAEVRAAQAALAQAHGIEAFCYWHYWFGDGRQLLERPFEEVLASGSPDISFCLGWANESWSGVWHGAPERILIEQRYPDDDDSLHFAHLLTAFRDERYLRVGGRPVFHVYRPEQLPDASRFVQRWQDLAAEAGLPGMYLVAGLRDSYSSARAASDGFDASFYQRLPFVNSPRNVFRARLRHKLLGQPVVYPYASEPLVWPLEWRADPRVQPCVVPNWDNTPRSGRRGIVLTDPKPDYFRRHVRDAVERLAERPGEERLLWVKSWNEWAEGNHLEPDELMGLEYLRVLQEEVMAP